MLIFHIAYIHNDSNFHPYASWRALSVNGYCEFEWLRENFASEFFISCKAPLTKLAEDLISSFSSGAKLQSRDHFSASTAANNGIVLENFHQPGRKEKQSQCFFLPRM